MVESEFEYHGKSIGIIIFQRQTLDCFDVQITKEGPNDGIVRLCTIPYQNV